MEKREKVLLSIFYGGVVLFSLGVVYYGELYYQRTIFSNIAITLTYLFGVLYPFFILAIRVHPIFKAAISFLAAFIMAMIAETLYPKVHVNVGGDVSSMDLFVMLFIGYWIVSTAIMLVAAGVMTLAEFIGNKWPER